MIVRYKRRIIKSKEDTIQKLSIKIGKLENKAIGELIDDTGLSKVLEKYLTKKELNIYYRSKYKLKQLLNEE